MDNINKAFIIVGAVLLALSVATISIVAFNSARSGYEQEENGAYNQRVAIFNSQFEAYFGDNRSKENAAAVCHLVENNNKRSENPYISCPSPSSYENASAEASYTIKGEYDSSSGYISAIVIS